jgi:glycosyltransferase involved in cell wall biosynthesis
MKFGIFLGNAGRNSGGPEIYESELVRSLARIDKQNQYEIFCLDRRAPSVVGVDQENFRYHVLWPAVRPVSMTVSLALASSRYKTQSLHATFMPPVFSPQPLILTLVCFSMFARPEYYPLAIRLRVQALTRLGLRTARYFLCVSNNVRELFADKFKIAEKRLLLSYMAASDIFHPIPEEDVRAEVAERFLIKDPYFLFSGRWEHRKNIVGTIQAFALFKKRTRLPHKLVLTGSRTWAAEEAQRVIHESRMEREIIDLGKSPYATLPLLYGGAEALVYASFWEGFGMPLVESMACGTPVITSNISSMPEVAGAAGLYVDPHSVEEIAEAMRQIAEFPALRARLSAAALERAKRFTWEETARRTLQTYELLANEN